MFQKVGLSLCLVAVGATATTFPESVVTLNLQPGDEEKFQQVYESFLRDFDMDAHKQLLSDMEVAAKSFENSRAATAYKSVPGQPYCDSDGGNGGNPLSPKGVSAFPGGVLKRVFGFDLSKMLFDLSQKAAGPAAATGGMGGILAQQALAQGAGMLQAAVSAAVDIIPPLIPPPVWNNMPLTCAPMVTGHNCFGAVLYPITMADFVIADVTDAMLDGYIAGFPNTYAQKVGQTSDAQYKMCFAAAMSMQCGAIFPRCTVPQSRSEPGPVGRVPLCFTSCISTLVACPGFWLEDIKSACHTISVPPMCTMATFWNLWRLPPQYVDYEDSHRPATVTCPQALNAADAHADKDLYAGSTAGLASSPYGAAAVSAA